MDTAGFNPLENPANALVLSSLFASRCLCCVQLQALEEHIHKSVWECLKNAPSEISWKNVDFTKEAASNNKSKSDSK